jgi:nucleoid-associated protein YgaU
MELYAASNTLIKLTITAVGETASKEKTFQVMYNPETISQRIGNKLQKPQGINAGTGGDATDDSSAADAVNFAGTEPEKLELVLIIDGSEVGDYAAPFALNGTAKTVTQQINTFKELCYKVVGDKHEPNIVNVKWSTLIDANYLFETADISYKSFKRNGEPLRAELKVVFIKQNTDKNAKGELSSPDVSHLHTVNAGDTLPLLAKKIYGSPKYYLLIAAVNKLDNFRALEPGSELSFPPLESVVKGLE